MMPHLSYLLSLNAFGLNSPRTMAQIMQNEIDSEIGLEFLKFILDQIIQKSLYQANLFDLLSIMVFSDK